MTNNEQIDNLKELLIFLEKEKLAAHALYRAKVSRIKQVNSQLAELLPDAASTLAYNERLKVIHAWSGSPIPEAV